MKGSKFAVFGVGKYGSAIARTLAKKGSEVHIFDLNPDKIETIKDEVALAVALDSTDKKALMAQDLNGFDAAVVAIGENFEGVILTTSNLMDLGVKRIIARATGYNQQKILTKIGVEEILLPEDEVADSVAEKLINPNITAFLQLPDEFEIAEIKAPKKIANETLASIELNNKYQLTLITLKRVFEEKKDGQLVAEEHIIGVTNSETIVYDTDTLVVFGSMANIKRFIEVNE